VQGSRVTEERAGSCWIEQFPPQSSKPNLDDMADMMYKTFVRVIERRDHFHRLVERA
jgi:hypothetical protein